MQAEISGHRFWLNKLQNTSQADGVTLATGDQATDIPYLILGGDGGQVSKAQCSRIGNFASNCQHDSSADHFNAKRQARCLRAVPHSTVMLVKDPRITPCVAVKA